MPEDTPPDLDKLVKETFGLSTSPADSLRDDDDWSFVIKMSAYVEAALTELLIRHFNDSKLETIIDQMNMGSGKTGKVAFVKELALLPDEDLAFTKLLINLRGRIVHRIRMLNLNLGEYLQEPNRKNDWKSVYKINGELALAFPRWFIFRSVMSIMTHTAVQGNRLKVEQGLDSWFRQVGKNQIFRREKGKPPESNPSQSEKHHPPEAPPASP